MQPEKIPLPAQQEGLKWAIELLDPLVKSLLAQGKINASAEAQIAKLKAVEKTLEFIARPDVELRRRI